MVSSQEEKLRSIEKNNTWELVEKSVKKPIDMKWVYKLKRRLNGETSKHKARLVVIGFLQKPSIDFDEVYAPVTRPETIRIVVSTTSYRGWNIHLLDIKSTFLNGPLEEEVYLIQPS